MFNSDVRDDSDDRLAALRERLRRQRRMLRQTERQIRVLRAEIAEERLHTAPHEQRSDTD